MEHLKQIIDDEAVEIDEDYGIIPMDDGSSVIQVSAPQSAIHKLKQNPQVRVSPSSEYSTQDVAFSSWVNNGSPNDFRRVLFVFNLPNDSHFEESISAAITSAQSGLPGSLREHRVLSRSKTLSNIYVFANPKFVEALLRMNKDKIVSADFDVELEFH